MTRRALVTGSAGAIGHAIVSRLHDDGWTVVGLDTRPPTDQLLATDHVVCDLADPSRTREVVASIAADGLSLLVNNAAVQPTGGVKVGTVEDWDHAFAVNVRAAFVTMQASVPALAASRGSIVNIGSVHARATSPGRAAYVASKAALSGLTRSAALELAPDVRANAVLPGAVDTPMLQQGLDAAARSRHDLEGRIPLRSAAQPTEIASVVSWLASDASYVTGQEIVVDGGVLARLASE